MAKEAQFSIDDLDVLKQCEDGFEFEFTDDATGKGTGIFLTVVGAHAASVQGWTRKTLNARRIHDEMQERRGKKAAVRPIEDDIDFAIEMAAVRIIGWRGITNPYSAEMAIKLCRVNPPLREQVLKASEDLANFTKKPAKG